MQNKKYMCSHEILTGIFSFLYISSGIYIGTISFIPKLHKSYTQSQHRFPDVFLLKSLVPCSFTPLSSLGLFINIIVSSTVCRVSVSNCAIYIYRLQQSSNTTRIHDVFPKPKKYTISYPIII